MNLLTLAQKLEDDGVGVQGKSIFVNMIPAECQQGVLLRTPLSGTPINYELPGYYRTKFKVIARARDNATGEALMQAAFASLTMHDTVLGEMTIQYMRPLTQPANFPLSKGNLLEFAADFETVFVA